MACRTVSGLDSLSSGVQLTVYRMVRESLTNALRHSADENDHGRKVPDSRFLTYRQVTPMGCSPRTVLLATTPSSANALAFSGLHDLRRFEAAPWGFAG